MKYLIFFVFIFGVLSCDHYDARLQVINRSNSEICIDIKNDTILKYPDINNKEFYLSEKIMPGDTKECHKTGATDAWEQYINESKDRTLYVFIFDIDTVSKLNWDTIRKYNKYIKRYDLNIETLKRNNWTIVFE